MNVLVPAFLAVICGLAAIWLPHYAFALPQPYGWTFALVLAASVAYALGGMAWGLAAIVAVTLKVTK